MYLFISAKQNLPKFKKYDTTADYIVDNNLQSLKSKVIEYADKYAYPKDEPKGKWVFEKKYGAVVEKYCRDCIGWIVKL